MPLTGKRKAEYMAEYHRRHPEKKQAAKQRHRERQAQKRQTQEQQPQENPKIQNEPARRQLLRILSDRPIVEIAQVMNVSKRTVYRWLRELQRDDPGFNRPRVPRNEPRKAGNGTTKSTPCTRPDDPRTK